jgi:hypothetical protein
MLDFVSKRGRSMPLDCNIAVFALQGNGLSRDSRRYLKASTAAATTTCAAVKRVLEMVLKQGRQKMSEVENLEKLRGHFVSARRQGVAKMLRSKSPSVVAAHRLKTTQDMIDALDRAIVDENRLHPPPVQQPETGPA